MKESKPRKEAFQTMIKVEMFGLRLVIINNWYIGVLALCSLTGDIGAQELAARYYLTQFWAEYTIDVLYDFNNEDL